MRNLVSWGAMTMLGAAVLGGGCGSNNGVGGGGTLGSCTLSESVADAGIAIMLCQEVAGSPQQIDSLRQGCMFPPGQLADAGIQADAHFSYGGCSHVSALGGCQITQAGVSVTNWYYEDATGLGTPDDIKMLCDGIGGTFVPR